MRPLLSIAAVLLFSLLFSTCTMYGPGTPAVMLVEQPLLVEIGDDLAKDTIPEGSAVSYVGEHSLDSAYVKVMFEGGVGWIPAWTVAIDATPAFVDTDTDVYRWQGSGDLAGKLTANSIVAVDTIVLNRSHITYLAGDGIQQAGWVQSDVVNQDLSVRNVYDLEYSGDAGYEEEGMTSLSANLSGVSQQYADNVRDMLGILVEVPENRISLQTNMVASELDEIVTLLVPPQQQSLDGSTAWTPDPRVLYFWAYTCQVPAFVDIGPRTDYAQYTDDIYKTEIQTMRAFLMKTIDRDPRQIAKLYETFGGTLKELLATHDVSEYITALILTYDHITSVPDYRTKCADVMNQVKAWDDAHADANGVISGGFILGEQRPLYAPILGTDAANEDQYETSIIWRYSFWLRRMAEGNDAVVYNILRDLAGYSNVKNGKVVAGKTETKTCKFEGYAIGDCGHMLFDCDDYGDADTQQLSDKDLKLWNELAISTADGEEGNPKYVGKMVTMKLGTGIGPACNDGQGGMGEVPVLLEFKLK